MNNAAWNKQDITSIIGQMTDKRVTKYNGVTFIRPDESSSDPTHEEFYRMTNNAGGAVAIQLNIGPLIGYAEDGSALAKELLLDTTPAVVMITDKIFKMDPTIPEFIIAHELGHIVNGDTVNDAVDTMASELKADRFAADTVTTRETFPAIGILSSMAMPGYKVNPAFAIAHEIGHFMVGHHDLDLQAIAQGTYGDLTIEQYEVREKEADMFAVNLLKERDNAVETLKAIIDGTIHPNFSSEGIPPDVVERSIDVVRRRLNVFVN